MLRSLTADHPAFPDLRFGPGLNVLVTGSGTGTGTTASGTAAGPQTEGAEGHGGPGFAEVLHFLLGASGPRTFSDREAAQEATFRLELDWPSAHRAADPSADPPAGTVTVRRSGADAARVYVDPDPAREPGEPHGGDGDDGDDGEGAEAAGAGALFPAPAPAGTAAVLGPEEWEARLARGLFRLPPHAASLSVRTLLSYLVRREQPKGLPEPGCVRARQAPSDATAHLAHLLGLDTELAGELHALALREQTGKQARKAVEDPALRRLMGDPAELLGRIRRAEEETGRLKEQVAGFRVGPAFEELRQRADELNRRMRTLPDEDAADRRTAHDLERALSEPGHQGGDPAAEDAAEEHLFAVYEQAGLVLGDQVRRSFEDVRAFHRSLVHNRRHHLQAELDEVRERIAERDEERARTADELSTVLRELEESGALEALTAVRRALAQREALVETLRHRYEAAKALESGPRRLRAERTRLLETATADLDERHEELAEAARLFTTYAHRLCGPETEAHLTLDAGPTDLTVTPHLSPPQAPLAPSPPPALAALTTLCLDLTLAALSHRHARGPGFLVHGPSLLAPLDAPHVAAALNLAAEVCETEGIQYIAVLHAPALDTARTAGHDPEPRVVGRWCTP